MIKLLFKINFHCYVNSSVKIKLFKSKYKKLRKDPAIIPSTPNDQFLFFNMKIISNDFFVVAMMTCDPAAKENIADCSFAILFPVCSS